MNRERTSPPPPHRSGTLNPKDDTCGNGKLFLPSSQPNDSYANNGFSSREIMECLQCWIYFYSLHHLSIISVTPGKGQEGTGGEKRGGKKTVAGRESTRSCYCLFSPFAIKDREGRQKQFCSWLPKMSPWVLTMVLLEKAGRDYPQLSPAQPSECRENLKHRKIPVSKCPPNSTISWSKFTYLEERNT